MKFLSTIQQNYYFSTKLRLVTTLLHLKTEYIILKHEKMLKVVEIIDYFLRIR